MKAILAALLTASVLTATSGAVVDPAPTTFWRGWAIFGTDLYFQIWNPGPGRLCVTALTVSSDAQASGVALLMHEPLPRDIATWDRAAAKDEGYNAASAAGIDLEKQSISRGQVRVSTGVVRYGGQLWSFRLRANLPFTIQVNDCLGPNKGVGIRVGRGPEKMTRIHFGIRWTE